MQMRIHFCAATVKAIATCLRQAVQENQRQRITHITALLLLDQEATIPEVMERLGAAESTIYGWIQAFLLRGLQSIRYHRPVGRPAKLTKTHKTRLCALLKAGPEAAGYASACWSSGLVQDVIKREFNVTYTLHYICELLHNLGFSYQKARFIADHLDAERRTIWLEQEWPQIVAEARRTGALLLFGDEASFAQWGSLGYTWAPIGEQPVVKSSGTRKAYKVFGLLAYFTGQLFVQGHTGRLNAESYCAFLDSILAATTQPLIVIHDGARYHTAVTTRTFVESHAERLTVYQLPSYSPDYNPIEHLWRNVKRTATHNHYFPEFAHLCAAVDAGLQHYHDHPAAVIRLMGTCLDALVRDAIVA